MVVFSLAGWCRLFQTGFLRSRLTQDPAISYPLFLIRGSHSLWLTFPGNSYIGHKKFVAVLQPRHCLNNAGLGSSGFAHHYSRNHCYFLLLQVLRCFSSLRSPQLTSVIRLQRIGFPHSDSHGSIRMCQSPWIFAACHVLLRLQEPRHPPCTLINFSLLLFLYVHNVKDLFRLAFLSFYPRRFGLPFGSSPPVAYCGE